MNVYDYWDASVLQADIATKETLALNNVLESFANSIKNSWVDAFVDSMVLVRFVEPAGLPFSLAFRRLEETV